MVSCSGLGFVGAYQCDGSQGFDPPNSGKYQWPDAADAVAVSQYKRTDAAHTVGEHQWSNAPDSMGKYERSDAADALEIT